MKIRDEDRGRGTGVEIDRLWQKRRKISKRKESNEAITFLKVTFLENNIPLLIALYRCNEYKWTWWHPN